MVIYILTYCCKQSFTIVSRWILNRKIRRKLLHLTSGEFQVVRKSAIHEQRHLGTGIYYNQSPNNGDDK